MARRARTMLLQSAIGFFLQTPALLLESLQPFAHQDGQSCVKEESCKVSGVAQSADERNSIHRQVEAKPCWPEK